MGKSSQKGEITREFSAGGAVFRKIGEKTEWLLINPAQTDRWQLPKGHIDAKESTKDAAVREVNEESGIKARIIEKIGVSRYFYVLKGKRIFKTVTYFLMEYKNGKIKVQQGEVDEAKFYDFQSALQKLTFKDDREILEKTNDLLGQGFQENLI